MAPVFSTYTNPTDPRGIWTADASQSIVNFLPQHSPIRRDNSSVGFNFVNDAAGIHIDKAQRELDRFNRDGYLVTASNDVPDVGWTVAVGGDFDLNIPANTKNLLRNGSFELASNQSWFADNWDWNGQGTISKETGLSSLYSLKLGATSNACIIAQPIVTTFGTDTPVAISVWYKTGGTCTASIYATASHSDGSTTTCSTSLPVSTSWVRRTEIRTQWSKPVVKLVLYIKCDTGTLFVDDVMVEKSRVATVWKPHVADSLFWFSDKFTPISFTNPRHIQHVGLTANASDRYAWWYSYPTRTNLVSADSNINDVVHTYSIVGKITDYYGIERPLAVKSDGNYIQRFTPATNDIYSRHTLKFPTLDGELYEDKSYTLKTITVFRNCVWAVISKADWSGTTKFYLAICPLDTHLVPQTSPTTYTDYLEVKALVELPITTSPTRIFFHNEVPDVLHIVDTTTRRKIRLFYDYWILDNVRGEIILREEYSSVLPIAHNERKRL